MRPRAGFYRGFGAVNLMKQAFPKPKDKRVRPSGIRRHGDGREVCDVRTAEGRREYKRRVYIMCMRQGNECGLQISPQCPRYIGSHNATFEHSDGRGGGKRDDRIEKDGKPINCAACEWCNSLKGSRRI